MTPEPPTAEKTGAIIVENGQAPPRDSHEG
jgi:hypothetical protein